MKTGEERISNGEIHLISRMSEVDALGLITALEDWAVFHKEPSGTALRIRNAIGPAITKALTTDEGTESGKDES